MATRARVSLRRDSAASHVEWCRAPPAGAEKAEAFQLNTSTPVMLLGGRENAVAVARNLGRLGVPILVSGTRGCRAMRSRYCRRAFPVPAQVSADVFWRDLLLTKFRQDTAGTVLISNCDDSMKFVARHRDELSKHYRIEEFKPELRLAMLDKLQTLKHARAVGVPTPQFWEIDDHTELTALRDEIRLPVIVKPLDSARFAQKFGRKLFIIRESLEEALETVAFCRAHGHDVMLVEMIPGPDTLLSSLYTYRTSDGRRLFDYTKSVGRRWPVNRGGACFHRSEWLPETAEMGRRLFEGIDWRGIGNVEFKRDPRDGLLKLIEINGRFTAAHRLVTEAGAPIDVAVYSHLTGQIVPTFEPQALPRLRMWYPLRDMLAFLEMKRLHGLSFGDWLRSLRGERLVFPYFDVSDPMPWLEDFFSEIRSMLAAPIALVQRMLGRGIRGRLSPNVVRPMASSPRRKVDLNL